MLTSVAVADIVFWDDAEQLCRMRKKAASKAAASKEAKSYYPAVR